jgi:hypothetical protein
MDEELKGKIAYQILIHLLTGTSGKFCYDRTRRVIGLAEVIGKEEGKDFSETLIHDLAKSIYISYFACDL